MSESAGYYRTELLRKRLRSLQELTDTAQKDGFYDMPKPTQHISERLTEAWGAYNEAADTSLEASVAGDEVVADQQGCLAANALQSVAELLVTDEAVAYIDDLLKLIEKTMPGYPASLDARAKILRLTTGWKV